MRDRRKRKILLALLACTLVFMGIGYAVLSQMLTISGVSTVAGDWNVYIESITPYASGNASSVKESVGMDKTSATFEAQLLSPGDKVEYKLIVKNDGNIDAKLASFVPTITGNTNDYVTYTNSLENGYILRHGESFVFYVTTELKEDITSIDVASRPVLNLKLNFTQYTGGGSGDDPSGGTIQILSGDIDTVGSEIAIGDEHFYVISSTENDVTMLAKYNLYVGNVNSNSFTKIREILSTEDGYNLQNENAKGLVLNSNEYIGIVKFSDEEYWMNGNSLRSKYGTDYPAYVYDENSNVKQYVDRYKEILEENDITIEEARLISIEELQNLGCTTDSCKTTLVSDNNRQWVYSSTYWLGSVLFGTGMYYLDSTASISYYGTMTEYFIGVRPVITISKSFFN